MKRIIGVLLLLFFIKPISTDFLNVVVLSQDVPFEEHLSKELESQLQSSEVGKEVKVYLSHRDFESIYGSWTIFPILRKLPRNFDFYLFLEPYTKVEKNLLFDFLKSQNPEELLFFGYGLVDKEPTIIHHFYGYDKDEKMVYPDFGAGFVFSRKLLLKILEQLEHEFTLNNFAIDPKFELAKTVYELTSTKLNRNYNFCLKKKENCLTWFERYEFERNTSFCGKGITNENVFFGVKTFSGYHKSRIMYIKRTWAKETKFIEYFSDFQDPYIPTIDLGIKNTEKGHCGKTFGILKHSLEHTEFKDVSWFVIADDDSLLSISRLYRILNCLPKTKKMILGERYGFGFSLDGLGGYDYPTGGSG